MRFKKIDAIVWILPTSLQDSNNHSTVDSSNQFGEQIEIYVPA